MNTPAMTLEVSEAGRTDLDRRPSLQDLAGMFLDDLDISDLSRSVYGRSLKQFFIWLEKTGRRDQLGQLTREDILAYKRDLDASGHAATTVSSYLSVVRQLYSWLESRRISPNIARGVRGARRPRGFRRDCLTPEQIRQALQSLDGGQKTGLRDYAILNLLARTGLRTIELARASIGDLRQESGQAVLWIQGKGRDSKDDFVLIMPETLQPIRLYLWIRQEEAGQALPDDAPLFSSHSDRNAGQPLTTRSISRIVKTALRRIGLDHHRLTAHSLRHSAISMAIRGGASIQQAQAMARHADPKTTMIYAHNMDRVKAGAERCITF